LKPAPNQQNNYIKKKVSKQPKKTSASLVALGVYELLTKMKIPVEILGSRINIDYLCKQWC
jgi:hypothetical protein